MSKLKQTLKRLGFDADGVEPLCGGGRDAIYGFVTHGSSAVELWRRLRAAAGEIGYWPVILGGDADLARHVQALATAPETAGRATAQDIIAAGAKLDVIAWLTERAAREGPTRPAAASSPWPSATTATHHFTLPMDAASAAPLPRVHIGLTPTVIGWQVPAFLRFGGRGVNPAAEHHVAMLKHWRHGYGAEIVSLGAERLELAISRPPQDRPAALRLAREQCVYCPGILRAGENAVDVRAASLLGATAWSFGWT